MIILQNVGSKLPPILFKFKTKPVAEAEKGGIEAAGGTATIYQ